MKFTHADRAALADALAPLDTPVRRAMYNAGRIPRADKVKNLYARYRWDLWWDIPRELRWDLFSRHCDAHIDTALRRAVSPDGLLPLPDRSHPRSTHSR